MVLPAVLMVFVLSPAPPAAATDSFADAARMSMSPEAALRIERLGETLPDTTALARAGNVAGVVELSWDDVHDRVSLRCYIGAQARWVDRAISFDAGDRDAERGRLVGLAVASMFIDSPNLEHAGAATRDVASVDPATMVASPQMNMTIRDTPPTPQGERASGAPSGRALEFAGTLASGIEGSGEGIGASAAFLLRVSEPFSLRLGVGARFGEVAAAQATTRSVVAGLGLVCTALRPADFVELDLRVDALASWLQVSHLSDDDIVSAHEHRWLFGGDALVTAGYRVSTLATLYAGGGMEALLGTTQLYTHARRVATIPALRAIAELGFRTNF